MLLEGKFILKDGIQELWDFLLKPETLATCIPGCEKWEAIDDKTFDSIIVAKVGFISVKVKMTTKLVEMDAPKHLKAIGRGEDLGKHGSFNQETVVDLVEVSKDEVEITYKSNLNVVGKLATFGDRVMRIKAKQIEEEFTQALKARLSGQKVK